MPSHFSRFSSPSGNPAYEQLHSQQECIPVGCVLPACCPHPPPPCEQNSRHTLLKILPCPKFVAGGKNQLNATAICCNPICYRPQQQSQKGYVLQVCLSVHRWGVYNPPGQTPPPPRWPLQRTVRILLECILVQLIYLSCLSK